MSPSGYLDNCLVPSGVVRDQIPPVELDALNVLFDFYAAGTIRLVLSPVTLEEIAKIPEIARAPFEKLYTQFEELPVIDEEFRMPSLLTSLRSGFRRGPIVRDAALGVLLSILRHPNDARHIFQAAKNRVDYFVTRDQDSILAFAPQIEAAVPILVRLPSQLVAELATS